MYTDTMCSDFSFSSSNVLIDGKLQKGSLTIEKGKIQLERESSPYRHYNMGNFYILPGIIDLHGDGFERHLFPRPSAPVKHTIALKNLSNELIYNGITTAYLAQCYSWEGGYRSPEFTAELLTSLKILKNDFMPDLRLQIRFETHLIEEKKYLINLIDQFNIDYLVFNNHLPEAIKKWENDKPRIEAWAGQTGRTGEQHINIVKGYLKNNVRVKGFLEELSGELKRRNITLGSHDDDSPSDRDYFNSLGAYICEFPTTLQAAEAAKKNNNGVIMGAPNIMRGGSQAGNIDAINLVKSDLVDCLVSDYYYPALLESVWKMADMKVRSFENSYKMISTNPARILNLADRGELVDNARADLLILNPDNRKIVAVFCRGTPFFVSDELVGSLSAA